MTLSPDNIKLSLDAQEIKHYTTWKQEQCVQLYT